MRFLGVSVTFSLINGHINLFNVYFYILLKIYCWFADIQLTGAHPWRELIWHTFSLHVITCAQGLQTAPQRCAGGILNNKITKTHRHAKQCGTEPTTEGHLFTLWGRKQWPVKLAPPQWETHTSGKPHLPSAEVCKWPWRHLEPWLGITSRSFSLKKIYFYLCLCVFVCVNICHVYAVPEEAKSGHWGQR